MSRITEFEQKARKGKLTDGELVFYAFEAALKDAPHMDLVQSLENTLPQDFLSILRAASQRTLERTEPDVESFSIGWTSTFQPARFHTTEVPIAFVKRLAGAQKRQSS